MGKSLAKEVANDIDDVFDDVVHNLKKMVKHLGEDTSDALSKSATALMPSTRDPIAWLAKSSSSSDFLRARSRQLHSSSRPSACGIRTSAISIAPSPSKSAIPAGFSQRCGLGRGLVLRIKQQFPAQGPEIKDFEH